MDEVNVRGRALCNFGCFCEQPATRRIKISYMDESHRILDLCESHVGMVAESDPKLMSKLEVVEKYK